MAYNFPQISVSEQEATWLREVYLLNEEGERADVRTLKVKLKDKLSKDFSPYKIDPRLIRNGRRLTLFGMYQVNPQTEFIAKTDKVIRTISELIEQDTNREQFSVEEVSQISKIPANEVMLIFTLLNELDPNLGEYQSYGRGPDQSSIRIGGENSLNMYLYYEGIEQLIDNFIKKHEPEEKILSNDLRNETASGVSNTFSNQPQPIFRSTISHIDLKMCFVLMPFNEDWSDRVYKKLIRENVEKLGLQCLRADNLHGQIIIEDIWTKINQCAFVIADVTTRNANVMYELGIVHTVGKPAILITQDLSTIPFDFTHLRHYQYDDNVDGFGKFAETLPLVIKDIYWAHYAEDLDILNQTTTFNLQG